MKFNYRFSNLCGSVYKGGNLVFSADGNSVLSPVGNRITVFDLVNHTSTTLPIENRRNIVRIALSPNGSTLVSVDESGHALIINFYKRVVLGEFRFKKPVVDMQFSPDNKYLAVTFGKHVQVWRAPALILQFRPLILHRTYTGHYEDVTCIQWSPDSLFFLTGSRDNTARLYSLHPLPGFMPLSLVGHHDRIVACFFGQPEMGYVVDAPELREPGSQIYTVSRDGSVFVWRWNERIMPPESEIRELLTAATASAAAEERPKRTKKNEDSSSSSSSSSSNEDEDEDDSSSSSSDSESDAEEEEKEGEDKNEGEGRRPKRFRSRRRREHGHYIMAGKVDIKAAWARLPFLARGTFRIHGKHRLQSNHSKIVCAALHGTVAAAKAFNLHASTAPALTADGFSTASPPPSSSSSSSSTALTPAAAAGPGQAVDSRVSTPLAGGANLLVVGFASGTFGLYQVPDFTHIHSLTTSQEKITTVAINNTGDWLAFGAERLGQLLVWEWRTETYVLKQQAHFYDTNVLAFSPDGQLVATGGDDGKVKLWNTSSGYCFVTFSDHIGPVTAVEFTATGTVVISAGADGTVRAYDLVRYRNFRTMVTTRPCQFSSLAIDPSGEIVTAGALDPFEVYVWSLQTGKLLEVLQGHQAPISALAFSASQSMLASGSWDKAVRLWNPFSSQGSTESLDHPSDILALAFRPDGKELAVSCLDGQIYVWDVLESALKYTIEGRRDILPGRAKDDPRAAANSTRALAFSSLCYSADGTCILAGGNSRYVCIYELEQRLLLRRFSVSNNLSFDAMVAKLNSKYWHAKAGDVTTIDAEDSEDEDFKDRRAKENALPGAQRGPDFSSRKTAPMIRTKCVRFSPTGQQWAACTTEGLVFYSLDDSLIFDPSELDLDVTPENCLLALDKERNFAKALVIALALNERYLIERVVLSTPMHNVPLVVRSLPKARLQRMLQVLTTLVESSRHLEFLLLWTQSLLTCHGPHIQRNGPKLIMACRALQKVLSGKQHDMARLCQENQYSLAYLATFSQHLSVEEIGRRHEKKRAEMQQEAEELARLEANRITVEEVEAWSDAEDEQQREPQQDSGAEEDEEEDKSRHRQPKSAARSKTTTKAAAAAAAGAGKTGSAVGGKKGSGKGARAAVRGSGDGGDDSDDDMRAFVEREELFHAMSASKTSKAGKTSSKGNGAAKGKSAPVLSKQAERQKRRRNQEEEEEEGAWSDGDDGAFGSDDDL